SERRDPDCPTGRCKGPISDDSLQDLDWDKNARDRTRASVGLTCLAGLHLAAAHRSASGVSWSPTIVSRIMHAVQLRRRGRTRTDMTHTMMEPRVLASGFAMVESPRWHDGRLWFPHWGTPEIIALDLDGNAEVMAKG